MESGTAGKTTEDGWLNRALPPRQSEHLAAARRGGRNARCRVTLRGERGAVAVDDLSKFQVGSATSPRFWSGCTRAPPTRS